MSSTKQDTEITGNQDTNTGSGTKKPIDVEESEQRYNNKKKATPTQQNNKDSRMTRSVSNGGGRDSNHSYKKPDKYKKEISEHGNHGNNRQGTKINNKDGGQHGWTGGHSRMSKFTGGDVPRRSHKTHSSKTNKIQENNADSGIGEGSSPEGAALLQKEINNDDTGNNNITEETTGTTILKNDIGPRHVYDRDFLLSIRTCTKSLITPAGLDRLQLDVAKDLLKGNHRQYGGEEDGSSDTGENESTTNHSSTLPFNKDCVDVKSKVSLMPQRRSFGSGCSWREHPINKPTTLPIATTSSNNNTVGTDDNQSINNTIDENNNEPTINWSCGTPRIIDHVPYRSRQANEWKGTKGHNWRKDRNTSITDECYDEDDEPEWMSFGPSDRYELMELKGIDDHESERKARNDSLRKNDDKPSSPEESPSSSPSDKDVPLIDSGLPSSCPNDDDDEYILDGFDFKSVLSICQELTSDNEYEEPLSTVTDSVELKNALITVLGISNTDGSNNTESHVRAMTLDEIEGQTDVTADGIDQTAFNKFLASIKHHDQGSDVANSREPTTLIKPPSHTVFPDSREATTLIKPPSHTVFPDSGEATTLIKPPSHTVFPDSREATTLIKPPSHTVFPDNLMYNDYQYYDTPPHNNTPTLYTQTRHNENHTHQSGWPTTSSALWNGDDNRPSNRYSSLHPSPSSLGMHPHHMRQQKQSSAISNNNWVTEMEQMRQSELQLRHYNKRQDRIMYQSTPTTQQKQQTAPPSLGFLPTSVMRHIHNSKPSQSIQDIARTPYSRMDHGYTPEGSVNYPPYSTDSNQYHHQSQYRHYPPLPPTNPNPQYQYINTSNASYRPNLRGGPTMEQGGMYHSQRSQYVTRQGSSPVKPPSLY